MERMSSPMIQHKKKCHQDAETMKTPSCTADEKTAIFHRHGVQSLPLSMRLAILSSDPSNLKRNPAVLHALVGRTTYHLSAPTCEGWMREGDIGFEAAVFLQDQSLKKFCCKEPSCGALEWLVKAEERVALQDDSDS